MEEYIGQIWHKWVTKTANTHYTDAAVTLASQQKSMGILFRALGGDAGLEIVNSFTAEQNQQRSWLQRIAGTNKAVELASRNEDQLRLPEQIAFFPTVELNKDLYLWLTLLATVETPKNLNWFCLNCQKISQLLANYPALKPRYQRLVTAHLSQRPKIEHLKAIQQPIEQQIQAALKNPADFVDSALEIPAQTVISPVLLWLYPAPSNAFNQKNKAAAETTEDNQDESQSKEVKGDNKKRQAERVDNPDGKDGFLGVRMENIFSWSEFVNVDRTTDDDEDEDALSTADDMEMISVSQDKQKSASKLKLNLDLPAAEYDDIFIGEGIPLPEWDYKKRQLQPDHCHLQCLLSRDTDATELPQKLKKSGRELRHQFEILRPKRVWLNRQNDGSELDLDYYISQLTDRKLGHCAAEMPAYRDYRHQQRDLSCLLLADLSLSTDTAINDDERIIDVIQDSLYLFAEALSSTQDRFALYGFSSRYRQHIRYHQIKTFDETYDPKIRGRIASIKPGYYTRMGAAIRYSAKLLAKEQSQQRLLLILTDGKPNDLDKYEGRYGSEDTRQAIHECKQAGIKPFCVTIDAESEDYLPYLFGHQSYAFIKQAEALPKKLALLYAKLTNNTH